MIIYRPIAPLTAGHPGLVSALAAMALAAVFGPGWQTGNEPTAAPDASGETARYAYQDAAGRSRP
jgi:hypothetical protein